MWAQVLRSVTPRQGGPGSFCAGAGLSLACWLGGSEEGKPLARKSPDSSVCLPQSPVWRLLWPPGLPATRLPPPGPSTARRRPPAVPRALYQIINKAAGAVHVNILAGVAGHCRGGLPAMASEWSSRAGHPHPGSSRTVGSASPLPSGAGSASA